jgi:hypothetical protein
VRDNRSIVLLVDQLDDPPDNVAGSKLLRVREVQLLGDAAQEVRQVANCSKARALDDILCEYCGSVRDVARADDLAEKG